MIIAKMAPRVPRICSKQRTFSMRLSTTVILEETLEPPTMATKGRLGALMAPTQQGKRGCVSAHTFNTFTAVCRA